MHAPQNSLFYLNRMAREAYPILTIITDCNLTMKDLGYYDNLSMQIARSDTKVIIISVANSDSNVQYGILCLSDQLKHLCSLTKGYFFEYSEFK